MDFKFIQSVLIAPPLLLGRQLLPYCCGHAVILEGLESAYMGHGNVTPQELLVAVWVCSNTYEVGKKKLSSGLKSIQEECIEWGMDVGQWHFVDANLVFQDYLKQHISAPDRWKKKESKSSKAPWPLTVVTTLMQELKIGQSEAWNMPLQQALWYFAAIAESKGDDSLISEQERERIQAAKEAPAYG